MRADAVVIGAGPNGLVAANLLADAGWDVLVLEAQPEPGGAVRSGEVTAPGYLSDLFSAFYPLGAASPVIQKLELERHGLRWVHAPDVLAHPLPDGRAAVLSRDVARTAASLDGFAPGDGVAWERLYEGYQELSPSVMGALFTPFPPVRHGLGLLRRLGLSGAVHFARFGVTPVRTFAEETFAGEGGGLLLAGNALHTDLSPGAPGSGVYGWLLAMLGQDVGFPVPQGGSGKLTDALVSRLHAAGGRLECDARVEKVLVSGGRATGVRLADGREVDAARAVVADVTAPPLFLDLVGAEHLPARFVDDLKRFRWDESTVKVDWALSGPIPWTNPDVGGAGTVHVAGGMDAMTVFTQQLDRGEVPAEPFVIVGQMTTADPSRSPAGTESAWGYTHVPRRVRGDAGQGLTGDWGDEGERERMADRIEEQVERLAPGFRDRIVARHLQFPGDLHDNDGNLVGGAVNGGTAAVFQQLFLRPTPGLGRPETPIAGLYLASSSAHPGGGVHGACGSNAATAALRAPTTGRLALAVTRRITAGPPPGAPGVAASRRSVPR